MFCRISFKIQIFHINSSWRLYMRTDYIINKIINEVALAALDYDYKMIKKSISKTKKKNQF